MGDAVASKTTLDEKNLEALGAERLAELLIEVTTGNAAAKRKLRLELAGAQSPKEAGRANAKRLTSISSGRGAISWKKRKAFDRGARVSWQFRGRLPSGPVACKLRTTSPDEKGAPCFGPR